jgi:membrane-associated phospholipid phosphatase
MTISFHDAFMFDHESDRTDAPAIHEKFDMIQKIEVSENTSVKLKRFPDHKEIHVAGLLSDIYEKVDGKFMLPQRDFMHSVTANRNLHSFLNFSSIVSYSENGQIFNSIRHIDPILISEAGNIQQKGDNEKKINGSGNNLRSAPPNTRLLIPGLASLALITFLVDEPVVNYARANQTSFLESVAHYTDAGGEKKIVVPGVLVTYVTARFLLKDERLKNTTLNSIQSIIVTAIATEGVKYLAGRARPFTMEGAYSFQPFPIGVDRYKSLPSGHASLAFALFTPYAETYSRWIYLVPVSVAFGRVYQDKHWLSDVVTGGGIGLISGILFTHHENIQIIPNGLRIYF